MAGYYGFNANISFTFQAAKNLSAHPTYLCLGLLGGSVAEWSARRTRNTTVLGSSPALATTDLDLFHGSPEFKSLATLVNSQLVCLRPVGILNNVMFNLNYLFQLFARPH